MPRIGKLRPGAIGLAFTLWDVYRRLPPKQRKQLMRLARTHGPKAAAKVMDMRREARARKR
jgi:predicted kinase